MENQDGCMKEKIKLDCVTSQLEPSRSVQEQANIWATRVQH